MECWLWLASAFSEQANISVSSAHAAALRAHRQGLIPDAQIFFKPSSATRINGSLRKATELRSALRNTPVFTKRDTPVKPGGVGR